MPTSRFESFLHNAKALDVVLPPTGVGPNFTSRFLRNLAKLSIAGVLSAGVLLPSLSHAEDVIPDEQAPIVAASIDKAGTEATSVKRMLEHYAIGRANYRMVAQVLPSDATPVQVPRAQWYTDGECTIQGLQAGLDSYKAATGPNATNESLMRKASALHEMWTCQVAPYIDGVGVDEADLDLIKYNADVARVSDKYAALVREAVTTAGSIVSIAQKDGASQALQVKNLYQAQVLTGQTAEEESVPSLMGPVLENVEALIKAHPNGWENNNDLFIDVMKVGVDGAKRAFASSVSAKDQSFVAHPGFARSAEKMARGIAKSVEVFQAGRFANEVGIVITDKGMEEFYPRDGIYYDQVHMESSDAAKVSAASVLAVVRDGTREITAASAKTTRSNETVKAKESTKTLLATLLAPKQQTKKPSPD